MNSQHIANPITIFQTDYVNAVNSFNISIISTISDIFHSPVSKSHVIQRPHLVQTPIMIAHFDNTGFL